MGDDVPPDFNRVTIARENRAILRLRCPILPNLDEKERRELEDARAREITITYTHTFYIQRLHAHNTRTSHRPVEEVTMLHPSKKEISELRRARGGGGEEKNERDSCGKLERRVRGVGEPGGAVSVLMTRPTFFFSHQLMMV